MSLTGLEKVISMEPELVEVENNSRSSCHQGAESACREAGYGEG